MARKRKRKAPEPGAGKPVSGPVTARGRHDLPLALVAFAGIVVTAILIWAPATGSDLPYCPAGSGCDVVQASAWSRFLGLPLALWGMFSYLALLLIALGVRNASRRARYAALLASIGFGLSLYLTAISGALIGAYCVYCLVSAALMTLAFALGFRAHAAAGVHAMRVSGLLVAAALALFMHAGAVGWFGGAGAVDPQLKALAEHLDSRGIKFYGASWCPHCNQQKDLFGGAARYLPYVECAPHGPRAPRATACEVLEIRSYPTWIIDGRKIERVLPVENLAALSGFNNSEGAAQSGHGPAE